LIFLAARGLAATLRFRLSGPPEVLAPNVLPQVIFCIWHNRLALSMILYERFFRRRDPRHRLAAMVSASRDGAFLAYVLRLFNVVPVRGSSSRRGPQALLELSSCAEQGLDLAITPDGPRGPRYVVQEGVVALARVTGLPILPISFHLTRKLHLKSWDRLQIPLPFARCEVELGQLIAVPREMSETDREAFRQRVESALNAITRD
jgi:hypothetical protein